MRIVTRHYRKVPAGTPGVVPSAQSGCVVACGGGRRLVLPWPKGNGTPDEGQRAAANQLATEILGAAVVRYRGRRRTATGSWWEAVEAASDHE